MFSQASSLKGKKGIKTSTLTYLDSSNQDRANLAMESSDTDTGT